MTTVSPPPIQEVVNGPGGRFTQVWIRWFESIQQYSMAATIDVDDYTGFGIENDGSNKFRLASSGFGTSMTGGSGVVVDVSEPWHASLDTLVHNLAEDSYEEYTYSGTKVSDIVTWTSVAKTTKIREVNLTYTGSNATTIVTKQYDGTGTLIETKTETLTYTGSRVDDITVVMS